MRKVEKVVFIVFSGLLALVILLAVWAFSSGTARIFEFHNLEKEAVQIEISGKDQPVWLISGEFKLRSWGAGGLSHEALIQQGCHAVLINRDMQSLMFVQHFDGQDGLWVTDLETVKTGHWTRFSVMYDKSLTGNDPQLRINGKVMTLTELVEPQGKACSDAGKVTYLGSAYGLYSSIDGWIRGVRFAHELKTPVQLFWQDLVWWTR